MAGPEVILFAKIAGTVFSAVNALQQGRAQSRAARQQADILQQQSVRERQIAEQEEEDFRRRVRRLQSESNAALSAAGVTGAGTPALVAEDLAAEAELQALRIRSAGATRSTRLEQEAALERFGGRQAKRRGFARAGAQLLTGLGRVDFGGGAGRTTTTRRSTRPSF